MNKTDALIKAIIDTALEYSDIANKHKENAYWFKSIGKDFEAIKESDESISAYNIANALTKISEKYCVETYDGSQQ